MIEIFLVLLAFICGVATLTQTTVNSRLNEHVHSNFTASFISFLIGTITLSIIVLLTNTNFLPTPTQLSQIPLWQLTGGLIGPFVVMLFIYLFPRIGGVQSVAIPIFGQIIMSVIIDYFGLFNTTPIQLSTINLIGIVILIVGVFVCVILPEIGEIKQNKLPLQALAFLNGCLLASQIAINGGLGIKLNSTLEASFISFLIGTTLLLIINIYKRSIANVKYVFQQKTQVWKYIGGVLGAIYVFSTAFLSPKIGTSAVIIYSLFGQFITSIFIDNFGLLESKVRKVSIIQIIGLAIMFVGVILVKVF